MSTATLDAVSAFAPIGLDELNAHAALQTRVDRKYVLSIGDLDSVLAGFDSGTRVLEIDGATASAYESVYFDTDDLASYAAAAHRRRRRFKVRTRAYLDSDACYLEVKTRGGRSLTVKERVEHPVLERDHLLTNGRSYVDSALTEAGIETVEARELHATLTTRYRRTTLYIPASESRATIDVELAWSTPGTTISTPGLAVVETKSGSTPSAVDRMLWSRGHRPANISKYGVGMAAIHPELPSNKWRRVLDRQLLPAITTTTSRTDEHWNHS